MAAKESGQSAVFGNLAYDYPNTETYPSEEYGRAPESAEKPKIRKVHYHSRRRRGGILFAVFGSVAAALMLFASIMLQTAVFAMSGECQELQERISELEEEKRRAQIAYAQCFELSAVDEYARSVLGMRRAGTDQVYYINSARSGETEDEAEEGFFRGILDSLLGNDE